ncbi:hypothetical protein N1851_011164 [Merluccius polli]|uniref:Peptidase aspartic putative domain-containing protein n=1 Tax=Merluccius polli TaxID=89951 RepID=A0AA47MYG6_MERPO|nr:hypothetical protein N1851_011164 [Merluccius polli]
MYQKKARKKSTGDAEGARFSRGKVAPPADAPVRGNSVSGSACWCDAPGHHPCPPALPGVPCGHKQGETCARTGAGNQVCVLSIVPVQIKAKNGNTILSTYAFFDPGSSATFCTEHLTRQLNMNSTKAHIFLRTMGQANTVSGPEVYTQQVMPVTKDNIVTQKDLRKWPYLQRIEVPKLDAEVELLIGTNAPKLLEPSEVINSHGDGPYAVRTLLGWVVNGPLRGGGSDTGKIGCSTVTVNRIFIDKVELLIAQYNQDFNEKSCE